MAEKYQVVVNYEGVGMLIEVDDIETASLLLDDREIIDQRIKWVVMEISNAFKDKGATVDQLKEINTTLLEKYKEFWQLVEPQMRIFYENLEKCLEVPVNIDKKAYTENDIENLETDIEEMEVELLRAKYFLKSLKDVESTLDKEIKLKEQAAKVAKVMERDNGELRKSEKIHKKVREQVEKYLEGTSDTRYLYKSTTKLKSEIVNWFENDADADPNNQPYPIKDEETTVL